MLPGKIIGEIFHPIYTERLKKALYAEALVTQKPQIVFERNTL